LLDKSFSVSREVDKLRIEISSVDQHQGDLRIRFTIRVDER
jgi:hypothetical protein